MTKDSTFPLVSFPLVGVAPYVLLPFILLSGVSASAAEAPLQPGGGFAVVELFTSQGCSSCPPADRVMVELDAEARSRSLPVYILSRHVDYWDYIGWADPYASPAHTRAQRAYAARFGSGTYTPQAVINGQSETVGSRSKTLRRLIQTQLDTPAAATVTLSRFGRRIHLRSEGAPPGSQGFVAFTRPRSRNAVKRGENSGRRLEHAHVVVAFIELGKDGWGELPRQALDDELVVTGWVRHPSGQILGATRSVLGRLGNKRR